MTKVSNIACAASRSPPSDIIPLAQMPADMTAAPDNWWLHEFKPFGDFSRLTHKSNAAMQHSYSASSIHLSPCGLENSDENTNHPPPSRVIARASLPDRASRFADVVRHATC